MTSIPNWAIGKFEIRKSSSGDDDFSVCSTCWAMVDINDVKMHDKWHQGETYIDPEA